MNHLVQQLRIVTVGLACAILLGAAAAAQVYEPFNYPAGSPPPPLNGGTGWAGPWSPGSGHVTAAGLTYPGLVTAGRAFGPSGAFASRLLASPIAGSTGRSLVLSALIRSNVNGTPATQATLGNHPGGNTFIIGDLPQADPAAGNWGVQTAAGRFYSNVPVQANVTTYLVAQVDFNTNGNNDRVRLWVNPPANAWFTVNPQVDDSSANIGQFTGVFWQTQQGQIVDEIRVNATSTACLLPPNSTMVAWYPFDEAAGSVALNLATANDGLHVNSPTPIPGLVQGALRFDGADDYVDSPSSIVTNFGPFNPLASCSGAWSTCQGHFSIDAWVRTNTNQQMVILDKRSNSPLRGYHLVVGSNQILLQLADPSGFFNYGSAQLAPVLNNGQWHHLAITVQRNSPQGIRFYHNGVQISTANPTNRQGSLVNNAPLRIGARTAAPPLSGFFDGDIDELQIFNRVLKPAEVKAIYLAGPFGKCK